MCVCVCVYKCECVYMCSVCVCVYNCEMDGMGDLHMFMEIVRWIKKVITYIWQSGLNQMA